MDILDHRPSESPNTREVADSWLLSFLTEPILWSEWPAWGRAGWAPWIWSASGAPPLESSWASGKPTAKAFGSCGSCYGRLTPCCPLLVPSFAFYTKSTTATRLGVVQCVVWGQLICKSVGYSCKSSYWRCKRKVPRYYQRKYIVSAFVDFEFMVSIVLTGKSQRFLIAIPNLTGEPIRISVCFVKKKMNCLDKILNLKNFTISIFQE